MTHPEIRILFASRGWPCGVWELASWAEHEGLADARVVPLREDEVFRVSPGVYRRLVRALEANGASVMDASEILRALGEPFVDELLAWRPHVVGFRIEGGQFERVRTCVAAARALHDATVVIGGPTVTSHSRATLDATGADFAFQGEAELPFAEFLRLARRPNGYDSAPMIEGLAYRWGGRTIVNAPPVDGYDRPLTNGTTPSYAACPVDVLRENRLDERVLHRFEEEPFESLFFTGGRGCPGACAFCAQLHGPRVRTKSAEQLLAEIAAADRLVQEGRLRVGQWPLFRFAEDSEQRDDLVRWAAVYDEDFFLDRRRAIEFLGAWSESPMHRRYRLSFQTNPRSLLAADGRFDDGLWTWIDRVKPMIQVGVESFHPTLLERWRKRHAVDEAYAVLEGLERTRQDYNIFHLLTDYESTVDETIDAVWLLAGAAARFPRMRIAGNAWTIPLFDSDSRKRWEFAAGRLANEGMPCTEYETPHPEWMDRMVATLADAADERLQDALDPDRRDEALLGAMDAIVECLEQATPNDSARIEQARWRRADVQERLG